MENIKAVANFKRETNRHFKRFSDEFLKVEGIFATLEKAIEEDDKLDFNFCSVISLLKEESSFLEETIEGLIYPMEEGQEKKEEIESDEDLTALKKQFESYLEIVLDDTMELNGMATVLYKAMDYSDPENKVVSYKMTVKLAIKKINDIMKEIINLLED